MKLYKSNHDDQDFGDAKSRGGGTILVKKYFQNYFALVARNGKTLCAPSREEVRWGAFSSVFWPLDQFATIKAYFFFDIIKGQLNYSFMSSETFSNCNCP